MVSGSKPVSELRTLITVNVHDSSLNPLVVLSYQFLFHYFSPINSCPGSTWRTDGPLDGLFVNCLKSLRKTSEWVVQRLWFCWLQYVFLNLPLLFGHKGGKEDGPAIDEPNSGTWHETSISGYFRNREIYPCQEMACFINQSLARSSETQVYWDNLFTASHLLQKSWGCNKILIVLSSIFFSRNVSLLILTL